MPNKIIPYIEMCQREGVSLQRGMNFELNGNHSVILMSVQIAWSKCGSSLTPEKI
jgi:hypothetical protein